MSPAMLQGLVKPASISPVRVPRAMRRRFAAIAHLQFVFDLQI